MKFRKNIFLLLIAIILYVASPFFFNYSMTVNDYISLFGSDEEIIVRRGLNSLTSSAFIPKDLLIALIVSIFTLEGNVNFIFAFKMFVFIVISIIYIEKIIRPQGLGWVYVSVVYFYLLLNPVLLNWHNSLLRDDLIIAALMLYQVSLYPTVGSIFYKIASYFILIFTRPQIFLVILMMDVYKLKIHYMFKFIGLFLVLLLIIKLFPIENGLQLYDLIGAYPNTFRLTFFSPTPINLLDIINGELVTDASAAPYWLVISFFVNFFLLYSFSIFLVASSFNKLKTDFNFNMLTVPFILFNALNFASTYSEDVGFRQMFPVQFFVSIFFIDAIFRILNSKRIRPGSAV